MSKNTSDDKLYGLLTVFLVFFLVTGSLISNFNLLDAAYLLFLISCVIRYFIICKENRD
jgi:hypothetical protein